jgi:hypothetical protein
MSDCGWLTNRMPEVALGRSSWTSEETDHLRGCPVCRSEWHLVRISSRLGSEVGAGLDPASISRNVFLRLSQSVEDARLRRKAWGFAAVATAAAAVVMLWAGPNDPSPAPPAGSPPVASLQIQLPELDNLQPAELNAVLQALDEPNAGDSLEGSVSGDLGDADIESGLDTWEG